MRGFLKVISIVILVFSMMFVLVACVGNNSNTTNGSGSPAPESSNQATPTAIPTITPIPTPEATAVPTEVPTASPTAIPTAEPTEEPTEDIGDGERYWVTGTTVNFRRSPSVNGEIISQLAKGTEVVKLRAEGDWLYISYGEARGYIHGDYASSYPPPNTVSGEVRIVVKKSQRKLELWQGEILIGSYSVGLGFTPEGHKQVEGDGKTPEGEYYVCTRVNPSVFYLSLGVSYPNKNDARAALEDGRIDQATYDRIATAIDNGQRPDWYTPLGGEIMIHGLGGSRDWTAGCVAVDNDVMDILFEYCQLGTRITILP